MKIKELIRQLSELDPESEAVVRINKYYTYCRVTSVETGTFDGQSGSFQPEEAYFGRDDYKPNAVAIKD